MEKVAGAVAGEHTAGAICPVSRWCETEQSDPSGAVTEAGDRAAPLLLVGKRGAALARDLLAPGDETGAGPAALDLGGKRCEVGVA
jgi:hypothetical protein